MAVAVGSVGHRSPASHSLWRPPGAVVSNPPQLTLTSLASDNFNRANGPIAGSNNWLATSDGSATIISNEASGVGSSIAGDYWTGAFNSDQYAQCTVGSVSSVLNDFVGLMLRHNPATNADYVGIWFNDGNPTLQIFYRTGPGSYTNLVRVVLGAALAPGTLLTFYAIGSVLVLQAAGASQSASVTDSTLTGGQPGLTTFGTMTLDNWAAGNASMGGPLGAAVGSDNFNRANGNVSTGQPNWTAITQTFSGVTSADGVIVANEWNVSDAQHHTDARNETYTPNQWSQWAVGSLAPVVASAAPFIGVIARWNGSTGYLFCFFAGGGGGVSYRIYLIQGGAASTQLAQCGTNGANGSPSPSVPTGTVLTIVCRGTRISGRINNTEVLAITDSSCVAGAPGVQTYSSITADNYSAGNA